MKLGSAHQGARERTLGRAERLKVPGYRLLQRVEGSQGWSAEGPGGFLAAIRFIRLAPDLESDGLDRLEVARRVRHPNLQTAYGLWRLGETLVLAAELPDRTLWDRYAEAVAAGLPGLPREELTDALAEVARGIDFLNGNTAAQADRPWNDAEGGLGISHDDVGPRSILYVGGGVKLTEIDPSRWVRVCVSAVPTLDADYTAPERLAGQDSRHSDQFSLAVTYCRLRTGRFPFAVQDADFEENRSPRVVDLSLLPASERPAIARALDPEPDRRWPSCRLFVEALRADVLSTDGSRFAVPFASEVGIGSTTGFLLGRAATYSFAAATGAVTLAGSLWITGEARRTKHGDRHDGLHADVLPPSAAPAPVLSLTSSPPPRIRLQDSVVPVPARKAALPTPGEIANESRVVRMLEQFGEAAFVVTQPLPKALPQAPSVRIEAPPAIVVRAGRSASVPVSVVRDGSEEPIEVRIEGLPKGLSAKTILVDGSAFRVEISADASSPDGETTARLVASSGPLKSEAKVALTVEPTHARSARRRGDALLRRGQYEEAVAAYAEAIKLDPDDHQALQARGLASYSLGDLDRALADFDASIKIKPDVPTVLNNRGLARLGKGDDAAALADFDAAVRIDPAYPVVRYNRGRAYAKAGNLESAVADYNEAIRLDPNFAKAYKARADVLSKQDDSNRAHALADYDVALRLFPSDPATLNNRGLLLFAKGDVYRAIADFDEAIRNSPKYAVVRYNRGRVYAFLGDDDEALASFEQAIRLDPNLAVASRARAELLAQRSEPARPRAELGSATQRRSASN